MNRKTKVIASLILVSLLLFIPFRVTFSTSLNEPIATLVMRFTGGGVTPDYCLFIANYLEEINIKVKVIVNEWEIYISNPLEYDDYDLFLFPDYSSKYLNLDIGRVFEFFCQDDSIPYVNESNKLLSLASNMSDFDIRKQKFYELQELVMDKIVPVLPLYASRLYEAFWSNTNGYDPNWGIVESLPYMSFDGYHEGQDSLDELNLAEGYRNTMLNPLFFYNEQSSLIWELLSEPILQILPNTPPFRSGLVVDWDQIDDFHYKFYMRNGIFWNPSYNVTNRDASSEPLDTIPTSKLMIGLKNGEFSDGTNQQVTAKDVVFTLLSYANPLISKTASKFNWISDIYVDKNNPLAFHILIDSNPKTPVKEKYVDFWYDLNCRILPEFFLNSSNPTQTHTTGNVSCIGLYPEIVTTPQWHAFNTSAFGCGKYMLNYVLPFEKTVLDRSPYWFGIGAIDGRFLMEPFTKTVNVYYFPDSTQALAEFLKGHLDWAQLTLFPQTRKELQDDPNYVVYSKLGRKLSYMLYNLKRPFIGGENNYVFLDNPAVSNYTIATAIRKAINYAIDREEMNKIFHDGEYILVNSLISPYFSNYYCDCIKYDRNIELSKQWLEYAGFKLPRKTSFPSTIFLGTVLLSTVIFLTFKKKRGK
ncbi:MAG: ABC transporter substrate-binding protein [Candidatus Heimdallarchaeaceae archaeon]